jgi:electron transfer flavoprotein-quinone oxidoreductase
LGPERVGRSAVFKPGYAPDVKFFKQNLIMEKFEVIIVGAGLAGLAAAYTLAKGGCEPVVVERGDYAGAKNITGGRLYLNPVRKYLPDLWPALLEEKALERPVATEFLTLMSVETSTTLRFRAEEFARPPYHSFTVLRGVLDRWLARKAEEKGAMLVTKNRVDDLIRQNGKITGVVAGGEELGADVVIACDGALSLIAEKAGLRASGSPQDYAVGFKEVIEVPSRIIEDRWGVPENEGAAQLFLGHLTQGRFGGGFLYTNRASLSLGVVLRIKDLKEHAPLQEAPRFLDEFKSRPEIAPWIAGGETVEYSAHVIPEAGFRGLMVPFADGLLVAGDAAGFSLNMGLTVRGMEFALASGVLAARTILRARENQDFSASSLSSYQKLLEASFVWQDLKTFEHVPQFLDNPRFFDHYPHLVGNLLQNLFRIDEGPKKKLSAIARETIGWCEVWSILKDLRRGFKI